MAKAAYDSAWYCAYVETILDEDRVEACKLIALSVREEG